MPVGGRVAEGKGKEGEIFLYVRFCWPILQANPPSPARAEGIPPGSLIMLQEEREFGHTPILEF